MEYACSFTAKVAMQVSPMLIAWSFAFAGSQPGVSIKVVHLQRRSVLDELRHCRGVHEVMLVDAQLTRTNAERVLQEIKDTHKSLSLIYITHEHADHFLGLEVFKKHTRV